MIDIDWSNDGRSVHPDDYLVDPDKDNKSRLKAFIGGWTRGANKDSETVLDGVRWVGLGMAYGSILGDIGLDQRREVYRLLLGQYLTTERVRHWRADQRKEALRLVTYTG
jgi:hypothetical protein